MLFFSAPKARRTSPARSQRGTFRPRLEALEDRCLLSAGALDPTFGIGGEVLGGSIQGAEAVVVQTDGKIVAGGSAIDATGNTDFALVRYMADGSLDPTFGTNGFVSTMVGSYTFLGRKASDASISGVALQSDGKIVAVGTATVGSSPYTEFAVACYLPNGQLDSSFGSGGIVLTKVVTATTTNTGFDQARAVAIQGDGKIDVAGVTGQQTQSGNPHHPTYTNSGDFALVRYNASGALDTSFGGTGIVVTPNFHNQADSATSQADSAAALAIQPDGKILQTGYTNSSVNNEATGMALVRYTTAGQLDSSFGISGIVTGLVPAGFAGSDAEGVLVQSNGFVVVAGFGDSGTGPTYASGLMLARLTSTGRLDTSFGNTGQLGTTDGSKGFAINGSMFSGWAIAQGANGDLLAVGFSPKDINGNRDFGVAAFLPGGAPDTTFGPNGTGTTTADFSGGNDAGRRMAIQGDGKIVAVGYTFPAGSSTTIAALARFLPPNTVQQALTSITVSPTATTVADGTTTQFTATALDQFGNPMAAQPTFTWSVPGGTGTIDPNSGVYTAPSSGAGTDTIQAAVGTLIGTAAVYYAVLPPTVTVPATVTLSSQGTSASLSVSATDPNPGTTIASYAWTVSGPSGVTFSANNGSGTGNNATANFTQAGTYSFTVTITDSLNMSTISSVQLIVVQVLTNISVSPSSVQLSTNQQFQFAALAYDQFGFLMTEPISWKIASGGGSISSTGLYKAPKKSGTAVIEAYDGSVFATTTITIV